MISCDYISSCNFSGCSYNLTSRTGIIMSGKLSGNNSDLIEVNEVLQQARYYLTVTDHNGYLVQSEYISFKENNLCPSTRGNTLNKNGMKFIYIINIFYDCITATTITKQSSPQDSVMRPNIGVIAAIVVTVLLVVVLVVLVLLIVMCRSVQLGKRANNISVLIMNSGCTKIHRLWHWRKIS